MTHERPPFPERREPPQVIRRDPNRRPPWPPNPPTPARRPIPPPHRARAVPPPPPPRRPPPPRPPAPRPPPPRPPAPVAAAPRKPRRVRRWFRIALACLLLIAVAGVAVGAWIDSSLSRLPALTDYAGRPPAGAGTTWLLVGSDGREGLTPEQQAELTTGGDLGASRTDTILLVHLPGIGSSTPATMVSIPRDSYVPIPEYGSDKINAAFSLGGPPLLAQTVEQATGLRIDHYAEVGFGGFAGMVDAVGGVTVCPAEPINDPLAGIDLPAGCQELDGRNALGYVRSRATARADLDRMANQRQFMSALIERASSPAVLLNPLRWYPLASAAADTVAVGDGDHVWDLARLGWALRGDVTTVTVPIGEFTENSAGSIVVWDSETAQRLFAALASDSPVPADVLEAGNR
ncbi:LCP family protein [Mycolicibacterium gilvum]|uniref:Cell envelope-related transcriptional attenuator n=1 Tax=Mycolicibacterium gilvum (strain DSM 45189 / LMG 24558 / Spyr1) TaxID=278137 RepID=E6TMG9_MYCSR|nr:LCP family protein [Mycolicibacterium gilvum]ADU01575.1 cell envelope-related transcriptional attenuator [Mycolicibacterium gilvum Spyr1]